MGKAKLNATETKLVKFLQGTHQMIIPIYQRTYSWTEKQCEQLWDDILKAARDHENQSHFLGSIVYVEERPGPISNVSEYLLIDGQQRLTTLSLLLLAFSRLLPEQESGTRITKNQISNYFLFNNNESGEKRYKLILTQNDKNSLISLLDGKDPLVPRSANIENNYKFFENQIKKTDIELDLLYEGIMKLFIVDIALDRTQDNPQLIFESLNSTGLELSQADLIRNYILMGLGKEEQKQVYTDHWHPMEEIFGHNSKSNYFDRFMRDYLTIKTGQIPNIKDVYTSFKEYEKFEHKPTAELVSDIHYYAKFFGRLAFEKEPDPRLNRKISGINTLKTDVVYPFLLEVYEDYDKGKITRDDVWEIFSMVESYVFRRAIVGVPTNSMNKIFASLASEIEKDDYLESLKALFILKKTYQRFPNDDEFKLHLAVKDVYNMRRIPKYLLEKIENHKRKEPIKMTEYTIEHIMPQTKNLSEEWRTDLGDEWLEVHGKYLHTVGNLTLTGYNSELDSKPFLTKRDMKGGYANSPLNLNVYLARLDCWNEDAICLRADSIFKTAVQVWKYPELPQETLEKYAAMEDEQDEDLDEDEGMDPVWEQQLANASTENRQAVNDLVSRILDRLDCIAEPYRKLLYIYTRRPTERKNLFAIVTCGRNTANVIFRIDPDSFNVEDEKVRKVAGWFFPRGKERRMSVRSELTSSIIRYLEHAYSVTDRQKVGL